MWDSDDLVPCGPATLVMRRACNGEIAFREMEAGLDIDPLPDEIVFTRVGLDEVDEVSTAGFAELWDDVSLQIAFERHNGDKVIAKPNETVLQ